jgi:hypothetical protein
MYIYFRNAGVREVWDTLFDVRVRTSQSYVIKHLALKVVRSTVLLQYDAFPVAFEIANRTPLTYRCRSKVENVHHVYIAASCTRCVTKAILSS